MRFENGTIFRKAFSTEKDGVSNLPSGAKIEILNYIDGEKKYSILNLDDSKKYKIDESILLGLSWVIVPNKPIEPKVEHSHVSVNKDVYIINDSGAIYIGSLPEIVKDEEHTFYVKGTNIPKELWNTNDVYGIGKIY